jgi:peroxiredoxin
LKMSLYRFGGARQYCGGPSTLALSSAAECHGQRATLVVIAVEPFDPRPLGRATGSFPFPILPDKKGEVAQSYGLTYQVSAPDGPDVNDANGNPKGLEIMSAPATYVIDQTGLVALAFVDVQCRSVMDHGQILMALECLGRRK